MVLSNCSGYSADSAYAVSRQWHRSQIKRYLSCQGTQRRASSWRDSSVWPHPLCLPMDQTELFRAMVKAVRLRIKAQRRESGSLSDFSLLSKSARKTTPFATQARDVATCISRLQQFLLQHRKDYINSAGHLGGKPSAMTDGERDQIDLDAQEFIRTCSDRIKALHGDVTANEVGEQTRLYRKAVHDSLRDYLKNVCKLYSEQRAVRVKRIVDRKRISRLQPEGYKRLLSSASPIPPQTVDTEPRDSASAQQNGNGTPEPSSPTPARNEDDASRSSSQTPPPDPTPSQTSPVSSTAVEHHDISESSQAVDDGLSPEERRMFEQENEQLFDTMSTLVDEVRQIEGKVLEISRLQEIFADKVLHQAKELDVVSDLTVESSENVREGNEQVRGAIKNKASFRLWILFILIVCSFALLFLDWYS